jgi:hypothetical protein
MNDDNEKLVFSSRLTLKFRDAEVEKKYGSNLLKSYEDKRFKNILFTLFLLIYGLNFVFNNYLKENIFFVICVYICLVKSLIFLITYCLISEDFPFIYNQRLLINKIITASNFLITETYFLATLKIFDLKGEYIEQVLLIFLICFIVKTFYVYYYASNFIKILIANFILVLWEILLLIYFFNLKTNYLFISTICSFVLNCLITFTSELQKKINFLINYERTRLEDTCLNICNNMSEPVITIKPTGKISYYNNTLSKIFNLENFLNTVEELEINSLNILRQNEFELFKNKNLDENYVKTLLQNITSLNEELQESNNELYNYISEYLNGPLDKQIDNSYDWNNLKDLFNKENHNNNTNELNFKRKLSKKKFPLSTVNNTVELPININLTIDKPIILEANKYMDLKNNNISLCTENNFKSEKITCIGKLDMSKIVKHGQTGGEDKEYQLFYFVSKAGDVNFLIKTSINSEKFQFDNIQLCKLFYLSKITGELMNPISNMIEIINSFGEDSPSMDNRAEDNYFVDDIDCTYSPSKISYFDKLAISQINLKASETKFSNSNITKINHLKCMIEVLKLLTKDFIEYCNMTGNKENIVHISPNIEQSPNFSNFSKNSSICESIIKMKKNNESIYFNPHFYKDFSLYEIIKKTINLFQTKLYIDKKNSKVKFGLSFATNLPSKIDIDHLKLESLIFNLFFHLYKTVSSGKINLQVNYVFLENNVGQLIFDVNIAGIFNSKNLKENFIINIKEGINHHKIHDSKSTSDKYKNESLKSLCYFDKAHLDSLMKNSDPLVRNNIMDNFNFNFHYYLFYLYTNKMKAKINADLQSQKEFQLNIIFDVSHEKSSPQAINPLLRSDIISPQLSHKNLINFKRRSSHQEIQYSIPTIAKKHQHKRRNTIGFNSNWKFNKKSFSNTNDITELDHKLIISSGDVTIPTSKLDKDIINFDYSFFKNNNSIKNVIDKNNSSLNNIENLKNVISPQQKSVEDIRKSPRFDHISEIDAKNSLNDPYLVLNKDKKILILQLLL